jgi:hypothetical protein
MSETETAEYWQKKTVALIKKEVRIWRANQTHEKSKKSKKKKKKKKKKKRSQTKNPLVVFFATRSSR